MEVSLKYVFFKSDEHETLLSAGVSWDVGGTGSKKVGAESFDTVTPTLFFGKGFGDLPDSLDYVKPFAVTGSIGLALPTRRYNEIRRPRTTAPSPSEQGEEHHLGAVGLLVSVQPAISPELRARRRPAAAAQPDDPDRRAGAGDAHQRSQDHAGPRARSIPASSGSASTSSSGSRPSCRSTRPPGKNVGVLGQVHFYLDDILPQVFSWTPFSGVLGPTQPR